MPIERNFQRKWYLFLGSAGEAEKETNFGKNIPYQRPGKTVEHPVNGTNWRKDKAKR